MYRVLLTEEEIKSYLQGQGAENVVQIDLKGRLGTLSSFIIATGRSRRQIFKISQGIVQAVSYQNNYAVTALELRLEMCNSYHYFEVLETKLNHYNYS